MWLCPPSSLGWDQSWATWEGALPPLPGGGGGDGGGAWVKCEAVGRSEPQSQACCWGCWRRRALCCPGHSPKLLVPHRPPQGKVHLRVRPLQRKAGRTEMGEAHPDDRGALTSSPARATLSRCTPQLTSQRIPFCHWICHSWRRPRGASLQPCVQAPLHPQNSRL